MNEFEDFVIFLPKKVSMVRVCGYAFQAVS